VIREVLQLCQEEERELVSRSACVFNKQVLSKVDGQNIAGTVYHTVNWSFGPQSLPETAAIAGDTGTVVAGTSSSSGFLPPLSNKGRKQVMW
jgi:hypothetical protein